MSEKYWKKILDRKDDYFNSLHIIFESAMRRDQIDSSGRPYDYYLDKEARHKLLRVRDLREKEVKRNKQAKRKKRFRFF